jgi:hypothetical protein
MKFIDRDGIAHVRVITPGQGTSAFYKEEQLARDAEAFNGGLVFIDHPGRKESKDRPERSLRDLVGPIVGTPMYEKDGKAGAGLYGDVRVAKHWRPFLEDLGADIGVSIRAGGSAVMEKIGGKKIKVAEKFNPGATFDFVTQAGRGGKMVALEAATATADAKVNEFMEAAAFVESDGRTEEARFMEWLNEETEEEPMELKEAQDKLTEAEGLVVTLTKERDDALEDNAKLAEAIALRDARDKITEAVNDKKNDLPDVTRTRLIESLTKAAPMKEGKLDEEALTTLMEEAIKKEVEYIESLSKTKPGIKGMGESEPVTDEAGKKALYESKVKRYLAEGKSKEDAERMARLFTEGR